MYPSLYQPQRPTVRPYRFTYDAQQREVVARVPVERIGEAVVIVGFGYLALKCLARLLDAA